MKTKLLFFCMAYIALSAAAIDSNENLSPSLSAKVIPVGNIENNDSDKEKFNLALEIISRHLNLFLTKWEWPLANNRLYLIADSLIVSMISHIGLTRVLFDTEISVENEVERIMTSDFLISLDQHRDDYTQIYRINNLIDLCAESAYSLSGQQRSNLKAALFYVRNILIFDILGEEISGKTITEKDADFIMEEIKKYKDSF